MEGGEILGTMNCVKAIEDCSKKKKKKITKAKVTVFYFLIFVSTGHTIE
jgi:hypothetical protein